MNVISILLVILGIIGAGCAVPVDLLPEDSNRAQPPIQSPVEGDENAEVVLPVEEYGQRSILKVFGEYIDDRFRGYHVGDDVEFTDESSLKREIPVVAIADGVVVQVGLVGGYGGLIAIDHLIDGKRFHALYGHVDASSAKVKPGDRISAGQFLANLGDHRTDETDGERKHLHFAISEGADQAIRGYETRSDIVDRWINPTEFFASRGLLTSEARPFDPPSEIGGENFPIRFQIPAGWEVEYIPSIQALNLFSVRGTGTARQRSQILIRYFDASSFQTLSTVTIYKTEELKVGKGNYTAKRYDIEKKPGVPPFSDQPFWRNSRHTVTDFRDQEGRTRYYVVAANPSLDRQTYDAVLASMEINQ